MAAVPTNAGGIGSGRDVAAPAQGDPALRGDPGGQAARRETAALLMLMRSGRLAPARYSELVEERGSAVAVLEREWHRSAPQTSFFADSDSELESELAVAQGEVGAWHRQGLRILTVLDAGYPENLRAAHDRPPLVFVAGRLKARDARAVAVIGSRAASPQGLRTASELSRHLVASDYTVVSGLAAGIDTAAHTAALKCSGRTIAVLGTGLMRCYPRANVTLQRRIAAQCAVISQFMPDAPPTRQSFPMRNAVMSGLSLASVVVEASYTSGARIQARCALAQGRPVFLLRPLLSQRWARELAERPAVYTVTDPVEVTATLQRITSAEALVA
jgi:DNA processing protein